VDEMKKREIYALLLFCGILLTSGFLGGLVYSQTSGTFYISEGSYPGAPTYTIWVHSGTYYAKTAFGYVSYSGTNASDIINDALAGGGHIYIREGTYLCDSPLWIWNNTKITGDGRSTILRLANNADTYLLRAHGADTNTATQNVHIEGLTIDGNGANQGAGTMLCSFTAIQNWTFQNNYVINARQVAIHVTVVGTPSNPTVASYGNTFSYNHIYGQSVSGDMFIMGMENSTISYNHVSGNLGNWLLSGGAHSHNLVIHGNVLRGSLLNGLGMESSTGITITSNDISNNVGYGIYITKSGSYGVPYDFIIANNHIQRNGYDGIDLSTVHSAEISNNFIAWNDRNGITLYNVNYTNVFGNHIYNNNQNATPYVAPNGVGIRLGSAISHNQSISENFIYDNQSSTDQLYGVYLEHAVTTNIKNNYFGTHSTSGVGGTFTNALVRYNVGFITENTGVTGAIATGTTVNHGLAGTPDVVLITPQTDVGDFYVSAVAAGTFTISFDGGGNHVFYWFAEYKP